MQGTNYATFNRNIDERNVNVNRNDNDWNDNWRFAGVSKSFCSPSSFASEEFYLSNCFLQPPSMRPISAKGFER